MGEHSASATPEVDRAPEPKEQPNPAALAVRDAILRAGREKRLRLVDVEVIADGLRQAWREVQLPRRPIDEGKIGWLDVDPKKCGTTGCACRTDKERRHLAVYHKWRQAGRVRKKYLGMLGKARAPEDLAAPLREQLERMNTAAPMDTRFLHDD